MALRKGMKIERGYATVEDGVNYREISEVMTEMGWSMNHSSARNYLLRAMRKFAEGFAAANGIAIDSATLDRTASAPEFQSFVGSLLESVECKRRDCGS